MRLAQKVFKFSIPALLFVFFFLFFTTLEASATPRDASAVTATHRTGTSANPPTKASFLNIATIVVPIAGTDYIFVDQGPYDSTYEYVVTNSNCYGKIRFSGYVGSGTGSKFGTIDMDYGLNGCQNTSPNSAEIVIDGTFSPVWAEYTDADTISFIGNDAVYTNTGETNGAGDLWARTDSNSCNNLLVVSPNGKSFKLIILEGNKNNGEDGLDEIPQPEQNLIAPYFPDSCEINQTGPGSFGEGTDKVDGVRNVRSFSLGNTTVVDPNDTSGAPSSTQAQGANGTVAEEADSCNSEGGEFSFILCPLLGTLNSGIETLDGQIEESLGVRNEYYEAPEIQAIWGRVRNIAYILLIPILLTMVISTALGFSFVDAYTIKRALPRLLVAVIFMALSYDICVLLIEITNNVGAGVKGIIASPFGGTENLKLTDIFEANANNDLGALVLGGPLLAIGAITALSLGILASYFLVAFLALIIIFALLAVRELIIIALIILAPLAILAWIFPGNDKGWKLWWGTFSKLLLMYPLIIGLLWTGRGFAAIVNEITSGGDDALNSALTILVKLTVYIGPFFFILAVFKWAGGAFGSLTGMVNDRGKGVFDRQKKYRGEKRKGIRSDIRAGNRFKGGSRLADSVNTRLQGAAAIKEAGMKGLYDKDRRDTVRDKIAAEEKKHMSEDISLQTKLKNDDFAHILTMETEAERMEYLANKGYDTKSSGKEAKAATMYRKQYGDHAVAMAAIDAKAASKTSYTDGIESMLEDIKRASHGDEALAMSMLGSATGAAAAAGRFDLGGGSYGEKANMLKAVMRADQADENGMVTITDRAGNAVVNEDGSVASYNVSQAGAINARQAEKARDALGQFDYARMHPTASKNLGMGLHSQFTNAVAEVSSAKTPEARAAALEVVGQQMGEIESMKMGMSSAPPEVQRIFNEAISKIDAKLPMADGSVQDFGNMDEMLNMLKSSVLRNVSPQNTDQAAIISGFKSASRGGGVDPRMQEEFNRQNEA
jgi:hypothetical protein